MLAVVILSPKPTLFLMILILKLFVLMAHIRQKRLKAWYLLMKIFDLPISRFDSFRLLYLHFNFVGIFLQQLASLFKHSQVGLQLYDTVLQTIDESILEGKLLLILSFLSKQLLLCFVNLLIKRGWLSLRSFQNVADGFVLSFDLALEIEEMIIFV